MRVAAFSAGADRLGQFAAIALGVSIPISVALDNILLLLVAILWLASGGLHRKLAIVAANPVAVATLALFGMLLAGLAYGTRNPGDGPGYLGKYIDLLFVPLFLSLFQDAVTRARALLALAATLAVIVILSFTIKLSGLPENAYIPGHSGNPVVFKQYLTHGILVAFGAFLFAQLAIHAASRRAKLIWSSLAVLATLNVVLLTQGRTGYVVLAALALYLSFAQFKWRGLATALVSLAALAAVLAWVPGPLEQRLKQAAVELEQWRPGQATATSIGLRLEFYRNSIEIVREHPVLGVGTGGFPKAYAAIVRGTSQSEAHNPHNEYLMIAAQIGLVGLALLLHLFWRQWRFAARLATPMEADLARALVITIAIGSLFNSLLLDHTEGLLYAWLTGLLFGGLKSQPPPSGDRAQ
ncbi:MAG: O-antigen ligase family protein [Betaproteobacteria bacterium]|nr:O-antigen ligase family protein [Betaproteobacteria bacterium]